MSEDQLILSQERIGRIVRRMALEIMENNLGQKQLVLAGVEGMGYPFAEMLVEEIAKQDGPTTQLLKIKVDKQSPLAGAIEVRGLEDIRQGGQVIIVDDVLNTGRTMFYCLQAFVQRKWKKVELAVLVERSHHHFPIRATYIGFEIATTLKEHIYAFLESDKELKVVLR